jgi:hypothetical protein
LVKLVAGNKIKSIKKQKVFKAKNWYLLCSKQYIPDEVPTVNSRPIIRKNSGQYSPVKKITVLQYLIVSQCNSFSGFCYDLLNQLLLKTRYALVYDQRISTLHVHMTIDSDLGHTIIYDHTCCSNVLNVLVIVRNKKILMFLFISLIELILVPSRCPALFFLIHVISSILV